MVVVKKVPKNKGVGPVTSFFLGIALLWLIASFIMMLVGDDVQNDLDYSIPARKVKIHIPSSDSFSACLFVKDENHHLPEWLAYHYHTFGMEYLVVGIEKSSKSSPETILNRWLAKIRIEIWDHTRFAPPSKRSIRHEGSEDGRTLHLRQEQLFYKQCIRHLKEQGRTWTLFVDSDEFVVYNYRPGTTTPDDVLPDYKGIVIPSVYDRRSISDFLKKEAEKKGSLSQPCITMPRLLFLGKETSFVDPMNLNTLRFSAHAKRDALNQNGLGKNMLDVSRIVLSDLEKIRNSHAMVKGVCWNPQLQMRQSLFQVNHYLGTWESYQASEHATGGHDVYDTFAAFEDSTDDIIRPWFDGFVETEPNALDLLEGAGIMVQG